MEAVISVIICPSNGYQPLLPIEVFAFVIAGAACRGWIWM
jgi:hypothetical protein